MIKRTVNRQPLSVPIGKVRDGFLNQVEFKGLCDNKNDVLVDQQTFSDLNNIYVDDENLLVSRPPFKFTDGEAFIVEDWTFGNHNIRLHRIITTIQDNITGNTVVDDNGDAIEYFLFVLRCLDQEMRWLVAINDMGQDNVLNVVPVQVEDKIYFWVAGFDFICFNTATSKFEDAKQYIYKPVTTSVVNGIESELEEENFLSSDYIKRYLYSGSSSVNFSQLISKKIKVSLLDKSASNESKYLYAIDEMKANQEKLLIYPYSPIGSGYHVDIVDVPRATITMRYSVTFGTIEVSFDDKYFRALPKLENIVGNPQLTKDGLWVVAFTDKGLAKCKLVASETVDFTDRNNLLTWSVDPYLRYARSSDGEESRAIDNIYTSFKPSGHFETIDNFAYVVNSTSEFSTTGFGTNTIYDIAYDTDGTCVIVGTKGKLAVKTGNTWTINPNVGFGKNSIVSIHYGYGKWVAVGKNNMLAYATDPAGTWTHKNNILFGSTDFNKVTASRDGGEMWVAVANTGKVAYATDPAGTWTIKDVGLGVFDEIKDVVQYSGKWAITSTNLNTRKGSIYTATDPNGTWTKNAQTFSAINFIDVVRGTWVMSVGSIIYTATDTGPSGTWTGHVTGLPSEIRDIAAATSTDYILVGKDGLLAASTSLTGTWTQRETGVGSANLYAVAYKNNGWKAVGQNGRLTQRTLPSTGWTSQVGRASYLYTEWLEGESVKWTYEVLVTPNNNLMSSLPTDVIKVHFRHIPSTALQPSSGCAVSIMTSVWQTTDSFWLTSDRAKIVVFFFREADGFNSAEKVRQVIVDLKADYGIYTKNHYLYSCREADLNLIVSQSSDTALVYTISAGYMLEAEGIGSAGPEMGSFDCFMNLDYDYVRNELDMKNSIQVLPGPYSTHFRVEPEAKILLTDKYLYIENEKLYLPISGTSVIPLLLTDNAVWYNIDGTLWTSQTRSQGTLLELDEFIVGEFNTNMPEHSATLDEHYLSFTTKENRHLLQVTSTRRDGNFLWYLPKINEQIFSKKITNLHTLSRNEMGIFTQDEIWYVQVIMNDLGSVLAYTKPVKSKMPAGCRDGSDIITALDGKLIIFTTPRGVASLSPQDFIATTEQTLTYMSDDIQSKYQKFYNDKVIVPYGTPTTPKIKIATYKYWIIFYRYLDREMLAFDTRTMSWWVWTTPYPVKSLNVDDQLKVVMHLEFADPAPALQGVSFVFADGDYAGYNDDVVQDALTGQLTWEDEALGGHWIAETTDAQTNLIDWHFTSQRLHFGEINNYKLIKALNMSVKGDTLSQRARLSTKAFRDYYHPESSITTEVKIKDLHTFIQRMNLMHVVHFQYRFEKDIEAEEQTQLRANSLSIKYELKERVR